jgi:Ran GTPase-activating protein (RanGAP) involved in mRNA processing and transport
MALSRLSGDEQGIILGQLCNTLEPRLAMYFSSASTELRPLLSPAVRQQLRADYEVAAALCIKMGMSSCKELREADFYWSDRGLSADDLATLGKLGSVLPALVGLTLIERSGSAGPDGVQRLAEGLTAGALPAVTYLEIDHMHVGDAGASAIAAALDQGALPWLEILRLSDADIGDAGLAALAPALRRHPALKALGIFGNPFGDEGLAALVAPPPPAGTPPLPTGGLKKLKVLDLGYTQVTDAGCAALAAALGSGALPALLTLELNDIPASAAAIDAVSMALARSRAEALARAERAAIAASAARESEAAAPAGASGSS